VADVLGRRTGWALALVSLALAACGGEPATPAPPSSSSSATGSVAAERSVDPDELAADLVAGLERSTTAQLTLDVDLGLARLLLSGVADYSADPVDLAGTMRLRSWREKQGRWGERRFEARVIRDVAYLGEGERFVAFDLTEPDTLPDWLSDFVALLDPLADLDDLADATSSATSTGTQTIAGEELERFVLRVDPGELPALSSYPASAGLPDEVEYVVWVDEEFRVRELTTFLDLGDEAIAVKVRMIAWGGPVTIEKPDESRIYEPPTAPV
jgi:hypothetical protein